MVDFMELRHFRYFVVVAEEQNVTRAAHRLHVAQPSLSRQIRDLEEEMGVDLFKRTAKSISLTEAGKVFLGEARSVLLRVDQAVHSAKAVCVGSRGKLRVGYAPSLTTEILPQALRVFEGQHPGVTVSLFDLSTEESIQRIRERRLDLALIAQPLPLTMKGLHFEKLVTYPFCCAVSETHRLARKKTIRLSDLEKEKWIVISEEEYPEYHDFLEGLLKGEGFKIRSMEAYDSVTGLMGAVEAGRGIAVVTKSLRHLAGNRLKLIPLIPAMDPLIVGALNGPQATSLVESLIAAARPGAKGEGIKAVTLTKMNKGQQRKAFEI
jgi:DNA-binding transcriptional LysR family regulator